MGVSWWCPEMPAARSESSIKGHWGQREESWGLSRNWVLAWPGGPLECRLSLLGLRASSLLAQELALFRTA